MKVHNLELSWSNSICQKRDVQSILLNTLAFGMRDTTSSTVNNGKCCLFTALFKSRGSIQSLMEPLGLVTTTMLLTQLVACLPSNAYYPRTPDYTLCSGVHVCWSEHSDSSFVYGFMILDYGFGTMTATISLPFLMIPSLTMRESSFFNLSIIEIGNRLNGCTTGVTVGSI